MLRLTEIAKIARTIAAVTFKVIENRHYACSHHYITRTRLIFYPYWNWVVLPNREQISKNYYIDYTSNVISYSGMLKWRSLMFTSLGRRTTIGRHLKQFWSTFHYNWLGLCRWICPYLHHPLINFPVPLVLLLRWYLRRFYRIYGKLIYPTPSFVVNPCRN